MKLWITFLVAVLAATAAAADSDHDRARRAVEEGQVLPLKDILSRVPQASAGQVIEAELEEKGGTFVYEIKVLSGDGRVTKLYYDARTGDPLRVLGRDGKR
jgi:uncharacterized membrane protein YkoI